MRRRAETRFGELPPDATCAAEGVRDASMDINAEKEVKKEEVKKEDALARKFTLRIRTPRNLSISPVVDANGGEPRERHGRRAAQGATLCHSNDSIGALCLWRRGARCVRRTAWAR